MKAQESATKTRSSQTSGVRPDYGYLVDQLVDPVVILNKKGKTCFMNTAAKRCLGSGLKKRLQARVKDRQERTYIEQVKFHVEGRHAIVLRLKVSEIEWMGKRARLVALSDVTGFLTTLLELQKKNGEIEERLKELAAERDEVREQIQELNQSLGDARASSREQTEESDRTKEELSALRNELEDQLKQRTIDLQRAEEGLQSSVAARQEAEEQAERLRNEIADLHDSAAQLQTAGREELEEKAKERAAELERVNEQLHQERQQRELADNEKTSLGREIAELKRRAEEWSASHGELKSRAGRQALELESVREQLKTETAERERVKEEMERLPHEREQSGPLREELQKACERLDAQAKERTLELQRISEQLRKELSRREKAEGDNQRLRKEISQSRQVEESLNSGLEYFSALAKRLCAGVEKFSAEQGQKKGECRPAAPPRRAVAEAPPPPNDGEGSGPRVFIKAMEKANALRRKQPSE